MFVAKCMRHGFAFLVNYILLNLLDPSDFGLMRYVTIILAMVNLLNEMGFSTSIVQKSSLDSDGASAAFTIALGSGAFFYLVLFLGIPPVAQWLGAPLLVSLVRVGGLAILFGSFSVVQRALLQRRMKFGAMAIIEVIAGLIGSSLAVLLALNGSGVWSLVFGYLCFSAVSSIAFIIYGGFPGGNYLRFSAAGPLWLFGVSIVVQRALDYFTVNLDSITVGKVFGEFSLGIYGIAFDIATMPRIAIGAIFSQVLISAFSRVQGNPSLIRSGFLRLTLMISSISVPFFVIIFAMPDELLSVLGMFRHDTIWMNASGLLRILVLVGVFYTLASYPGTIWISLGKVKLRIIWSIAMLVSMCVAVLCGIPFGVKGICWALLIRAVIIYPVLLAVNQKVFSVSLLLYFRQLVPSFLSGLAMFTFLTLISHLTKGISPGRNVLVFATGITTGLLLYVVIYASIWKEQFRSMVGLVVHIFRRSPQTIIESV